MITKYAIRAAYKDGIISVVDSPRGDGAVCKVGNIDTKDLTENSDNWFYFGGNTAEGITAKEYIENVPEDDIIDEIFYVIDDWRKYGKVCEKEYTLYEQILKKYIDAEHDEAQVEKDNKARIADTIADLEYYINTNSENGTVWSPEFVIEKCIKRLKEIK